jgi:hypothetical protein
MTDNRINSGFLRSQGLEATKTPATALITKKKAAEWQPQLIEKIFNV